MSRTPVREALGRLEVESLVTRSRGQAPVVSNVGVETFVCILDMRRILEVEAAVVRAEAAPRPLAAAGHAFAAGMDGMDDNPVHAWHAVSEDKLDDMRGGFDVPSLAGLRISFGIDTAGSAHTDLLSQLRIGYRMMQYLDAAPARDGARLPISAEADPASADVDDFLRAATANAGLALGHPNLGRIEPGCLADVVLVRPGTIRTEWNEIARTSLVETSAAGPYARSAKKAARTLEFFDKPAFSSGPESVARAVEAAATSRRPRTRYAAGRGGVLMPVTRRVLPDRVFDAVVGRLFV